jgi:DNA-binding transcriptional MerR regulator
MSRKTDSSRALFPIRVVARRTGLKPDLVRAWERKYGAVVPARSDANRRAYSEAEIERLRLLRRVTELGHPIRIVARLPDDELIALLRPPDSDPGDRTADIVSALDAVLEFDEEGLRSQLDRAEAGMGRVPYMERFLTPLLRAIGDSRARGTMQPAHEHLATKEVRDQLSRMIAGPASETSPRLVVATLSGQLHDLGTLMVSVAASELGWNVSCPGSSLAPEEISAAVSATKALAVAISLVYPEEDPRVVVAIDLLRRYLPSRTALLLGGRAVPAYRARIRSSGTYFGESLTELTNLLDTIRSQAASS